MTDHLLECLFWCNDVGSADAEDLGIDRPDPVKRRGVIRLDHVTAFNEDLSRTGPAVWVYFENEDTISVAMPYDSFRAAYFKWATLGAVIRN